MDCRLQRVWGKSSSAVDRVLIAESTASLPAASRQQFYVSASRARESVTIYTDDTHALREAVQRECFRTSAVGLMRHGRKPMTPRRKKYQAFIQRMNAYARRLLPPGMERSEQVPAEMVHER